MKKIEPEAARHEDARFAIQPYARAASAVAIGFVLLGVALRLAQYAHNRALWLDEAALALQIVYKSPPELLGPLGWHQNSPIAFLLTVKFITLLAGTADWALRLLPIASGAASVVLFAVLARIIVREDIMPPFKPWVFGPLARERWDIALVAIAMFAVGKHLIYYSSELRHYSTDIALTCLLLILALRATEKPQHIVILGVTGVIATWFSLASIFVLGAIGGSRVLFAAIDRNRRALVLGGVLSALWLGSFLIHLQIHSRNIEMRGLGPEIALHNSMSFMPLPPTSVEDLKWFRETFEFMFYIPVGLTYRGLGAFAFLAGCFAFWRKDRRRLALLLLPFVIALFASGLERYPFRDRYILFLAPCLVLLIAEGVGFFLDKRVFGTQLIGALLFAMLFAQPFYHGLKVIVQPRGGYEIKPLLAHMVDKWEDGDGVYLPLTAVPPFMYYAPRLDFAPVYIPDHLYDQTGLDFAGLTEGNVILEPHLGSKFLYGDEGFLEEFQGEHLPELLARSNTVWILFEHDTAPPIRTPVGATDDIGLLVDRMFGDGASLYRYRSAGAN